MRGPACSQADSPVSRTHLPGSDWATRMTAHSGQRCSGLLPKQGRLSLWLKTCLESSAWRSTVCYLTWKVKATKSGRWFFQLAPSMPRIVGIESGLLPTMRSGLTGNITPSRANDRFNNLESVLARRMFPTPRSSPNENRQTKPTPSQLAGKHGMNLATVVNLLPTPVSRDWKSGKRRKHKGLASRPLNEVVLLPTPTANRRSGLQSHGVNAVEGSLNPAWVEWMMGYPEGWTDILSESQPFQGLSATSKTE